MHNAVMRHKAEIADLCQKFEIRTLEVFGSAAAGALFNAQTSDIDLLVTFEATALKDFKTWIALKEELELIFQRPVDLLQRSDVETSRNYIRRNRILREAMPLYAAGQ